MATMWKLSALACCDMKAPKQQGALPPLPAPDRTMWQYGKQIDHYTAEQMKAYACQYAEMCNEKGWCTNGCEYRKSKEQKHERN